MACANTAADEVPSSTLFQLAYQGGRAGLAAAPHVRGVRARVGRWAALRDELTARVRADADAFVEVPAANLTAAMHAAIGGAPTARGARRKKKKKKKKKKK